MADAHLTQTNAPITEESFLADRMSFWHSITSLTVKITASLIYFCAWLWWCSAGGFTFFHVLALPVVVALIFLFL
jgi:hypothetical protein